MNEIDIDLLRELLSADFDAGKLTWKRRSDWHVKHTDASASPKMRKAIASRWNGLFAGREALTVVDKRSGHLRGKILGVEVKAHRVIWAMFHGKWPAGVVDHINGDPSDNRIGNLRDVSPRENARNKANISEHGVNISYRKPWHGLIVVNGERISTGFFDTREEVCSALAKLERLHLKEEDWWYAKDEGAGN